MSSLLVGLGYTGSGFTGRLQKRLSLRQVCFLGVSIQAIGLFLSALGTELWQYYISLGIVGVGSSIKMPLAALLPNAWFRKRAALMAAISTSGAGVGGVFFATVLRPMKDSVGIRGAFLVLGVMELVLGSAAAFVVHLPGKTDRAPKRMPQPQTERTAPSGGQQPTIWDCPGYRWLLVSTPMMMFFYWVPTVHGVQFLRDAGRGNSEAEAFTSALGIGGFTFRLPMGLLADRIGKVRTYALIQVVQGLLSLSLHRLGAVEGPGLENVIWVWAWVYGGMIGSANFMFPASVAEVVVPVGGMKLFAPAWGLA